jgi:hypothetical protein
MVIGELLGLSGAVIVAVSALYYAVDVLRGGTRRQRTSRGVWAVVGVLGVASSDAGGASPPSAPPPSPPSSTRSSSLRPPA